MKIRFKDSFAGSNVDWQAGEVRDVPEAKARRLIDRGLAEAVFEANDPDGVDTMPYTAGRHVVEETAIPPAVETAVKRAPRKKRKGKRNVERP